MSRAGPRRELHRAGPGANGARGRVDGDGVTGTGTGPGGGVTGTGTR
ncbi:hypothetical protein GA0115256_12833 [Streptomyces sp. DconLS]|nr:hypothetical protein GA0115256_12833 [Streptomyces sp. DconLS]